MSHPTAVVGMRRIVRDLGLMVVAFLVVAVLTGLFFDSPGEHATSTRVDAAVGAVVVGFKLLLPYLLAISVVRSLLLPRQSTAARSIGVGLVLGALAGLAGGILLGISPSVLVIRLALISSAMGALHGALSHLDQARNPA